MLNRNVDIVGQRRYLFKFAFMFLLSCTFKVLKTFEGLSKVFTIILSFSMYMTSHADQPPMDVPFSTSVPCQTHAHQ